MSHISTRPELLAPAGNFEKLEVAVHYGADAVYLAGKDFSLRNLSHNFTPEEMARAVAFAHARGVKVYVACNVYARNHELDRVAQFLKALVHVGPDAVIISDPGIVFLARQVAPTLCIHLSTQANTTNFHALDFWKQAGVSRVNLARELSLEEIRTITRRNILETETFIHGAMCISYSGRCLLSNFLTGRDSNRGMCSHPCRWEYSVVEAKRPGQYHPVEGDERGTYIFNAKDLCMIAHMPDLIQAGINALKIEGRMKGIGYLASVVKIYREAIDLAMDAPDEFEVSEQWQRELALVYHRDYSTGFYFKDPHAVSPNYQNRCTGMIHAFIGRIHAVEAVGNGPKAYKITLDVRNKLSPGDRVEVLRSRGIPLTSQVLDIEDPFGNRLENAQPNTRCTVLINLPQTTRDSDPGTPATTHEKISDTPTLSYKIACEKGDVVRKVG